MATKLFEIKPDTVIAPDDLKDALQQAIELEQATIPVYLYPYYSIKRSWKQNDDPTDARSAAHLRMTLGKDLLKNGYKGTKEELKALCEKLSIDIQVYANKSAALIMSVVIEEMLHMALSSNIKQAIFEPPVLFESLRKLNFPTDLPGHEPELTLQLSKFSFAFLEIALRVESPLKYVEPDLLKSKKVTFNTIGDFYAMIETCVKEYYPGPYDNDRPQLLPGRNYYFPNSINTVYYDRQHCPHHTSSEDSGDLVHVYDSESALYAMNIIVEQGEGHQGSNHLDKFGKPQCKGIDWDNLRDADYDDPTSEELSHFMKFLEAYCKGQEHKTEFDGYGLDFMSYLVHNTPLNPKTAATPDHISYANASDPELAGQLVATSNLINAIYSYLFLMVETCYYQKGHTQFEVFMMGVHKSMIWALSELCNTVTSWTFQVPESTGDGKVQLVTYNMGPSFEMWDFKKSPKSPKEQIVELILLAPADKSKGGKDVSWTIDYVAAFPDVLVDHTVSKNPLIPTVPGQEQAIEKAKG